MITYPSLCSTCVTYRMSCYAIGRQELPTKPLTREAEDFPGGSNHSGHMPLHICLAWLQPSCCNPKFVFKHVKTETVLLVVKTLIKNIEQQPWKHKAAVTLISSHKSKNQNNCSLRKCISEHGCTLKLLPQKMPSRTAVFKIQLIKEILTDEHK